MTDLRHNEALQAALAVGYYHMQRFLEDCQKAGLVVEVQLVPRTPLAMGEYDMVPSIRAAKRHSYRKPE